MTEGSGGIVEADVRGYFDRLDRARRREVLCQRGNDGSLVRLIGKWLRAGGMEVGVRTHPETGVVPGGVMAPVLANVCLHHVLEEWVAREGRPRMQGRCFLLRLAEDLVIGCEAAAARRSMAVLPKRFGLPMHPAKPALIAFQKPEPRKGAADGHGTCDLRGLTHSWTRSRQGCWVRKRRTARKRLRRTKQSLWRGCRTNRHAPVKYQYHMLG